MANSTELWRELAKTNASAPKGTQCFVSWRHVDAGVVPWCEDEKPVSCWGKTPASTKGPTGPIGIKLEAQKAEIVGPLFKMDQPWELNYNMYFANAIYEDGWYRIWYTCVPQDYIDNETGIKRKAHGHVVCYAQSREGKVWEKPKLGLYSYNGIPSNIIYGREMTPYGFQSGSIFVDPVSSPAEKYKMFFLGVIDYNEDLDIVKEKYYKRFGDAVDSEIFSVIDGKVSVKCMCAAVSPNGIHWNTVKEPVMAYPSDTLNTCVWDWNLQKYVAYIRLWKNGRRIVGRAESNDFYLWRQKPAIALEASLEWSPCLDVYTNSRVNYPGSDERLMFPGVFDRYEDRRKVYMAVSEDELSWNWVPGGCIANCGVAGQWDGGDLNPGVGMVFLNDETVALPVMVSEEPHKYPRDNGRTLGKLGWMCWKKGRLGCISAEQYGTFSTTPMICCGNELSVNLDCAPRTGMIRIELQDERGKPMKGYTFSDAEIICTSSLDYRVRWNGETSISSLNGKTIRLNFEMRISKIYSFEFI